MLIRRDEQRTNIYAIREPNINKILRTPKQTPNGDGVMGTSLPCPTSIFGASIASPRAERSVNMAP